jgi:hypothetical protein
MSPKIRDCLSVGEDMMLELGLDSPVAPASVPVLFDVFT